MLPWGRSSSWGLNWLARSFLGVTDVDYVLRFDSFDGAHVLFVIFHVRRTRVAHTSGVYLWRTQCNKHIGHLRFAHRVAAAYEPRLLPGAVLRIGRYEVPLADDQEAALLFVVQVILLGIAKMQRP